MAFFLQAGFAVRSTWARLDADDREVVKCLGVVVDAAYVQPDPIVFSAAAGQPRQAGSVAIDPCPRATAVAQNSTSLRHPAQC